MSLYRPVTKIKNDKKTTVYDLVIAEAVKYLTTWKWGSQPSIATI